ncbi:Os10g0136450 [Oryza sativa Japonica Group]|uniref:Os10g0136450 protein n=2 Tax=Oryza sativa subsp. japonica TaxID=39947 RepID=C7J7R4_ORYSJ|nr:Os10g0136450 [Oryza sativa Japonica Group]BAT09813.1 Os10g0136450 [Oryza sativa Japonica Group]|eukprot:NP_001176017.1 Os10g0136450 [Oryza sativa Japonica Group]
MKPEMPAIGRSISCRKIMRPPLPAPMHARSRASVPSPPRVLPYAPLQQITHILRKRSVKGIRFIFCSTNNVSPIVLVMFYYI